MTDKIISREGVTLAINIAVLERELAAAYEAGVRAGVDCAKRGDTLEPSQIVSVARAAAVAQALRELHTSAVNGTSPGATVAALTSASADPAARLVFQQVRDAMQSAEELGGPEGQDYLDLMTAIADESMTRYATYSQTLRSTRSSSPGM